MVVAGWWQGGGRVVAGGVHMLICSYDGVNI
jgi:hypothetical protein